MQRLILATAVADKRKDTQDSWLRDEIHKIVFHHFSPHRLNAQFKRILLLFSFFFQGENSIAGSISNANPKLYYGVLYTCGTTHSSK